MTYTATNSVRAIQEVVVGWQRIVPRPAILFLLVALAACQQSDVGVALPVDDGAPIRTNKASYVFELDEPYAQFSMTATYVNNTDSPIYIDTCGPSFPFNVHLEKREGETWHAIDLLFGCASVLIAHEVRPGDRFTQVFNNLLFDATVDVAGTYWMVWSSVWTSKARTKPVPFALRVSNAFALEAL